jgi:magnesium and cobalt exporter, CNNM family
MTSEFWFETVLIVLLILANGFFSGSEIAIVSVRRSRIDQLIEEGRKSAEVVARLKDDSDRFLATVQIGITLVGSLASAVGGASAVEYLEPIFRRSGIPFLQEWGGVLALGTVVMVISYLSLVLGELVPKSLALRHPERIACAVARPLDLFSRMFSIIVRLLTASSNVLLFLSGSGARSTEEFVSEEEVKYLMREGAEKGVFDDTEKEFIHSVFDFADTFVREVMTPRTDIHALEVQTLCPDALHQMVDSGFSRMPVYEEDLEHIIGIVHVKELLRAQEHGKTAELRDFLHPVYFVPDSMQISHLLRQLQVRRTHMAIVVNEFGTVIGLATIEDLLEEIVGEIRDEFDVDEEQPIQEIREGVLLVEGGVTLSDLKDQYHLPVEETAAYRTLAGLLLAHLERIPRGGESIIHEGYRFTIVEMEGRRIAKVKVEKLEQPAQPSAGVSGA